mmetsp:Transcript_8029/g.14176  ORF Transcript_8029/g.14176 Transcript_8029/m.14176 type:complete len:288 (+) Transcript_8029:1338-2201(+)
MAGQLHHNPGGPARDEAQLPGAGLLLHGLGLRRAGRGALRAVLLERNGGLRGRREAALHGAARVRPGALRLGHGQGRVCGVHPGRGRGPGAAGGGGGPAPHAGHQGLAARVPGHLRGRGRGGHGEQRAGPRPAHSGHLPGPGLALPPGLHGHVRGAVPQGLPRVAHLREQEPPAGEGHGGGHPAFPGGAAAGGRGPAGHLDRAGPPRGRDDPAGDHQRGGGPHRGLPGLAHLRQPAGHVPRGPGAHRGVHLLPDAHGQRQVQREQVHHVRHLPDRADRRPHAHGGLL